MDDINVPGFDVFVTQDLHDGVLTHHILVTHCKHDRIHIALRVFSNQDEGEKLVSAFCLAASDAALPDDLPVQEEVNAAAETVLSMLFGGAGDRAQNLIRQLQANWTEVRNTLEKRWSELEAEGVDYGKLVAIQGGRYAYVGLAYRTTLLGQDVICGVRRASDSYERLSDTYKVVPLTHDFLSLVENFSSEEKLRLLHPDSGPEYDRARAEFDAIRFCRDAYPIDLGDAVAITYGSGNFRSFAINRKNGDRGHVSIRLDTGEFAASLRTTDRKLDISIGAKPDKPAFVERNRVHQKIFSSPEDIDRLLVRILQVALALDLELPPWIRDQAAGTLDTAHPVLSQLSYSDADIPLLSLFLGEPYTKAQRACERRMSRQAKKAEAASANANLPTVLADGAIVGKIDKRKYDEDFIVWLVKIRLGQVRTCSGTSKKRREIQPLCGFKNTRPLTVKQLSSLPPLKDPDALRFVHDAFLTGENRDLLEAAYRLSLTLDPGSANPLLDGHTEINYLKSPDSGLKIRVTRMSGNDVHKAVAISVALDESDWPDQLRPLTGASFLSETINGKQRFYTRPALRSLTRETPPDHWSALRFAIGLVHTDPNFAATAVAAFMDQWKDLEKMISGNA